MPHFAFPPFKGGRGDSKQGSSFESPALRAPPFKGDREAADIASQYFSTLETFHCLEVPSKECAEGPKPAYGVPNQ